LAAELSADRAVTATMQKVSNLILNINVYVRDMESGEIVQVLSARYPRQHGRVLEARPRLVHP
jgi:hypothetical protein